jgi:hypothetical protein
MTIKSQLYALAVVWDLLTHYDFYRAYHMKPNSITNYSKQGVVPTHIAVIVALISTMKDEGLDFFPIFEKVKSYSQE